MNKSAGFLKLHALGLFTVLIIFLIVIVKYFSYARVDPILYFYTIAVTAFELSRVTGSFLYSHKWSGSYEPKISFVIPVKNEEKVISDTLKRCYEAEYPRDKIEVIIVNDGSTDNTWQEIEKSKKIYPGLVAVNWKINRGKRQAMAKAIRLAKGEIIVQLDSDSFVEKGSLKALIRPFQDPKIGAVVAHTDPVNKDENFLTKMQVAYYFMSFRALKAAESFFNIVFCCSGCCSAYRKSIILPLLPGWTKETFLNRPVLWGDDRALTNLVLKEGYDTIYSDNVQAYTIVPNSLKQFLKQQIRWKKGWFVNSIKASKFILKRDWFVALTYFFPLILITLATPIIAFKALVLNPLVFGISPVFYIFGVFLVSALLTIHYSFFRNDKYWKYMFAWTFLNMAFLSYALIYALADLKNIKWGTR